MYLNPTLAIDAYKIGHIRQYPEGTTAIYSNFTPRTGTHTNGTGLDGIIFFGLQAFIKWYLIDSWNKGFFERPEENVVSEYKRRMDTFMGKDTINVDHIRDLHKLGYLPIMIKALPEGIFVPYGVPCLTIVNTKPEFYWITNYLETIISNELWKPCTSATTAMAYRLNFERYSNLTGSPKDFIQWQGHDFSCRGMSGIFDSMSSGAAHAIFFTGSDTVAAVDYIEQYYGGNAENELILGSVPASEHSVMSIGSEETEIDTYKRLITEVYPSGIVSIVSDTYDFWKVVTEYLPTLKETIMNRNGRLVIRPDTGNPVDIICGTGNQNDPEAVRIGAYESLWNIFGGTINDNGFKVLDTHIGMIYGDSITLQIQEQILHKLFVKGFTASNLVLGIGSYTYQYVTRDTHGFAIKSTWGSINNIPKDIFKNPKTGSWKKSAKGLLKVVRENNNLKLIDGVSKEDETSGELGIAFIDGIYIKQYQNTFTHIRERAMKELKKII